MGRTFLGQKPSSSVGLLLIDVINDLDFDKADELLVQALPMVHKIVGLKRMASNLQIPTIYVNDNFGQWKSDFDIRWIIAAPTTPAVGRFPGRYGRRPPIISF
jgi:hypothetical protein